jgi:hypothetical protein
MTWVYRDGKMVEKEYAVNPARSALSCPNVIRDGLPNSLQHMANGRFYDSKRAMEKADKEAGCVCIGNEVPQQPSDTGPPHFSKNEVVEAYKKVRDGYKPEPIVMNGVPEESGWN